MVIIGAGGFAKEVLQVVLQTRPAETIVFYDDVHPQGPDLVFGRFTILKSEEELRTYFNNHGNNFTLGIGGSQIRQQLHDKITGLNGHLVETIDPLASIGTFSQLGIGSNVLSHACISNGSRIGKAALIYYHSIVSHDCVLGDFVEISPGATLLGHVHVGSHTQIGANATILSKVNIGSNCLIGAGAVVTKDVPNNAVVAGVPAKILKYKTGAS